MKKVRNILFTVMLCLGAVLVTLLLLNGQNEPALRAVKESLSQTTNLADTTASNGLSAKAIGAGLVVGLAALGGTIGMGMAISKSAEGISRQPQAEGKIRTTLMLGLVFIETVVIYALIVAILLIFVL